MNTDQVVDALVAKARLILPRAGLRKLSPGWYEACGHRVQLELLRQHQGSPAEILAAQAAGNPLVELVVVTGGKRNLLADYVVGWTANSTQVPVGGSAIQAISESARVSFEEVFPSTRAEAMHVALMEAQAREHLAKEKLAARAAVTHQQSTNSSFSLGSQASLSPKAGSWSLDMQRMEEPDALSARGQPQKVKSLQQVTVPPTVLQQAMHGGSLTLKNPDTAPGGSVTLKMPEVIPGGSVTLKVPEPLLGGSLTLPVARTMGALPSPQNSAGPILLNTQAASRQGQSPMRMRGEVRSDSRQRAFSPAPDVRRTTVASDERARSVSPLPKQAFGPPQSPRVRLQWQATRNAYAAPNKQQPSWLLEERGGRTRSVSPDNRQGGRSPMRMHTVGAMPNSSPTLNQYSDGQQNVQPRKSAPQRFASLQGAGRWSEQGQPTSWTANPPVVVAVQALPSRGSREGGGSVGFPMTTAGPEPLHSPNPPARPVRKPQERAAQDPGEEQPSPPLSARAAQNGVATVPPTSARLTNPEEPSASPKQDYRTATPKQLLSITGPARSMSAGARMYGQSITLPVKKTLQVESSYLKPSSQEAAKPASVTSQSAAAHAALKNACADLMAAAANLGVRQKAETQRYQSSSPVRRLAQQQEMLAPPASSSSIVLPMPQSGASSAGQFQGAFKSPLGAVNSDARNNGSVSLPAKVAGQLKGWGSFKSGGSVNLQAKVLPPGQGSLAPPQSPVAATQASGNVGVQRSGSVSLPTKAKTTLLWDVECFSDSQLNYELTNKSASVTLPMPLPEKLESTQKLGAASDSAQTGGVSPELLNAKLLSLRAGMLERNRSRAFSPGLSRSSSSSSTKFPEPAGVPVQAHQGSGREAHNPDKAAGQAEAKSDLTGLQRQMETLKLLGTEASQAEAESKSGLIALRHQLDTLKRLDKQASQDPAGSGKGQADDTQSNTAAEGESRSDLPWSFWQANTELRGELADLRRKLVRNQDRVSSLPAASPPQTSASTASGNHPELPWSLWEANSDLRDELSQLRQKLEGAAKQAQHLLSEKESSISQMLAEHQAGANARRQHAGMQHARTQSL